MVLSSQFPGFACLGDHVYVSEEVMEAQIENRGILCSETSIYGFGLNPDDAIECVNRTNEAIYSTHCVPAPVLIDNGDIFIGAQRSHLMLVAEVAREIKLGNKSPACLTKVSMWNMASVLNHSGIGTPTIAAASYLASRVDPQFSMFLHTGGAGAIPKDVNDTYDISNDMAWFAQYPFLITTSFEKGFFDLFKSREFYETHGIVCAAYGQDNLPMFWCENSGLRAPVRVDSPIEAAQLYRKHRSLGMQTAVTINIPCPSNASIPRSMIDPLITQILEEAKGNPLAEGNRYTPFILGRFAELTKDKGDFSTVRANLALFENNAKICGQIATEYLKIKPYRGFCG